MPGRASSWYGTHARDLDVTREEKQAPTLPKTRVRGATMANKNKYYYKNCVVHRKLTRFPLMPMPREPAAAATTAATSAMIWNAACSLVFAIRGE